MSKSSKFEFFYDCLTMIHHFRNLPQCDLPQKFTYPFCYTPHPLALEAAKELQEVLTRNILLRKQSAVKGRMFGVLVVDDGTLGYLAAYSGSDTDYINKTEEGEDFFVPQIYNLPKSSIPSNKEESIKLQNQIFSSYEMLNVKGEEKNLLDIFAETPLKYPPSGSGDCCAPKLLQYAFRHHLRPVCMAEFWWGESPKEEIRHHQSFYPACQGRCKPILSWMLQGLEVDEDPMTIYNADLAKQLTVVYEDDWLIVVDKPSGMLSAPGKVDVPCVTDYFPDCQPVHRLDMPTSGLQILVKQKHGEDTENSSHLFQDMQKLFANRHVRKRYVALLDGIVKNDQGTIKLPISSDYLNRPAQRIDYEHGKTAITEYEVLNRDTDKNQTCINLWPHTGRTHQLRVHCAANEGLGCPIVGDMLYGRGPQAKTIDTKQDSHSETLQLRAVEISFQHPVTQKDITIQIS